MNLLTSKTPPSANELIEILKREFSDQYTYQIFGIGNEKSILVKKSFFVGAQISKRENEFTIDGIHPSVSSSLIALLLQVLGNLYILFSPSPYRKFEKEIGLFLKRKYN